MDGRGFPEETVLAAVKPLRTFEADAGDAGLRPSNVDAKHTHDTARSSALAELFQRHHDRVFRTAYRVTGSAADAEDVLQTVFVRVVRDQEAAEHAQNTAAYFARAAINASLDLLRSRKRSRTFAVPDISNLAPRESLRSTTNPETEHEDRELRKLVRDAISKLGRTAAQMFVLRYFEGLGNAEIAQTMNTSPLVVGVTLHRARARMRREIGEFLRRTKT